MQSIAQVISIAWAIDAAQIQVYNMQGNLVLESKIQDQNELDVTHLSSGIYITRVMVEDAVSVAKFVKY